ncbi:hemolysin family protein [Mycetocola zhujimingii]|uniref:HlyC/CorC family transporter n=1 Tax=Mycetocola zhujimingii TaxID=2079792 RepID=A0A2U1TGX5_9MICO|nr:hemolysin family protein [Mycetocola zhujimingii]AWB86601.1 HlyC/CorC family transporter [Mycetocola zhujimingii]PWC08142.1 HlyC/CorC family transporter [Mycetocola zhujimingii]
MTLFWFIAVAIVLVAFGGLMASVDAAIGVKSRADIAELASHSRHSAALQGIADDPNAHLNAVNFIRILAETTAAVLVTLAFAFSLEEQWLVLLLSALIMTAVSFVLVGASPRSYGRTHADTILRLAGPLVRFIRVLLGPLADALVALGNRVTPGVARNASFSSEEQLLSMVDEATELDVLEEDDRELIHSIFEFNETVVREVMIPRTDMVTVDASVTVQQAMSLFLRTGVSRVPVTDGEVDDVVGVLYLKDVVRLVHEGDAKANSVTVRSLAREALFVPESKKADSLLQQMQLESNHLAMVVDEYGGIAGLVTLEDLLEELVGDISDEYDADSRDVEDLGDGRYRVNARLPVDELGELFDLELDDDEVDSVGGLLAKLLGRLPVAGSAVETDGLVLTAERTEGRRKGVSTILVERTEALKDVQESFEQSEEK